MEPYRIVVGVDLSARADVAIDHALAHSRRCERAELHVLHVSAPEQGPALDELARRVSQRALELPPGAASGGPRIVPHRRSGLPAEEIAELALRIEARMIFVGSRGNGPGHHLLGSVARRVSTLAPCAVCFVDTRPAYLRRFAVRAR